MKRLSALDAAALAFIARHAFVVRVGRDFRALSAPADAPGLPPEIVYRLRDKRLIDRAPVEGAYAIAEAGRKWLRTNRERLRAA